jgi:intein/homing endonuclease
VPIELFHEDDDARKFAMMGYSDAEGCCSSVLDNGDRRVRWKSVNKTGLLQIKELLRAFGISTRKLTSDRSKNGKVKSAYPCWELVIGDHVNLSKFYRYVGFGMQSKQTKLRNALMSYKQRSIIERIVNIKYVENSTIIGAPWCRSA